jgi:hypothetical protein
MPISSVLVTRFFQLVVNRQFAEAERELQRLKQRMHKTNWNKGYYKALYGILLAQKSNRDQYAFFPKINFNDKQTLQGYKREFLSHVKNKLHGDYDRGFFSAWADCMRVLAKMVNDPKPKAPTPKKKEHGSSEADNTQITIQSFMKSGKRKVKLRATCTAEPTRRSMRASRYLFPLS